MAILVLLAEGQLLFRRAIRELLSGRDISILAEASDGFEAVQLAAKLQPDVAVLDVFMPLLNGLDAGKEILRVSPNSRLLLLSCVPAATCLRDALAAGFSGFVSKCAPATTLESALRRVAAGSIYWDSSVGSRIGPNGSMSGEDCRMPLTGRERQVVQLIAEGRTTKEIANLLGLKTKTVESHRQRAMTKLAIEGPAQLVRYAIRASLVEVRIPPHECRGGEEHSWSDNMAVAVSAS